MRIISSFSQLALASAIAAQGVVSPAHFARCEGNTYSATGLGSTSTPDRVLQVHDDLKGTARSISSISFRRDGSLNSASYNYGAYTVLVDIFVSTAASTAATISTTFDLNHGANKTQVGAFRLANLPATKHKGSPAPFGDYKITFAQPWAYNGLGSACIEIKFNSKTNTQTCYMDFQSTAASTNPSAYDETRGTGCKATGYTTAASLTGSSSPNWPANTLTLSWSGSNLPKSSLVYLCLGASDTVWSGLPLPLALPGTAAMPSGACTVYTDWSIQIPSLSNAAGALTQSIGFAVNPFFNGASVYSQVVALDAAANSYGGIMTNGVQHNVIAPYTTLPVSLCYAQAGLPANGTVLKNQCFPLLFE